MVIAVALAGCGGSGSGGAAAGAGPDLGVAIELADCSDWNEGSVEERLGTIRQLRNFIGAPVPGTGGRGRVLDDDQAYELFEARCGEGFAQGFGLYKIYSQAAAFSGE
jgi:hypothetical protein